MYFNSWYDDIDGWGGGGGGGGGDDDDDNDDDVLQYKMDAIKVEPASDEETDTISSVHDFLQINIKSEYSLAVEAEPNEVKVCSILSGIFLVLPTP
jgi:hypothetical protein